MRKNETSKKTDIDFTGLSGGGGEFLLVPVTNFFFFFHNSLITLFS